MKVRQFQNGKVAWFNSFGVDNDGNKLSTTNFVENNAYISSELTQKLSVIKNELWYDFTNGLPLTDKVNKKVIIDNYVLSTIQQQNGVLDIISFTSNIASNNHTYRCNVVIHTIFGQLKLTI